MMSSFERIGFTGHQGLTENTESAVRAEIRRVLSGLENVRGLSSLAEGADQIFADLILESGGDLIVVVPSLDYETTFDKRGLENYHRLLKMAASVINLEYAHSNEEAFWAAGRYVVDNSDRLLAVWNGEPAGGLGGTADVVEYAHDKDKVVTVIWPEGSERK